QLAWSRYFDHPVLYLTVLFLGIEVDIAVGVGPVHGDHDAGQRQGLGCVVLRGERMVRQTRLGDAEGGEDEQAEESLRLHEGNLRLRTPTRASAFRSRGRGARIPIYLMTGLADLVDPVARFEERLLVLLIDRVQGYLHTVLQRSGELVPTRTIR